MILSLLRVHRLLSPSFRMARLVLGLSLWLGVLADPRPPPVLRRPASLAEGKIAVLSAVMEHHRGAPWHLPKTFIDDFHSHYGNIDTRTAELLAGMARNPRASWHLSKDAVDKFHARYDNDLSSLSSFACHLRLYGVALNHTFQTEDVFEGAVLVRMQYFHPTHQGHRSPPPLYCYYTTSFHTGGNIYDKPKTLSEAINCPITAIAQIPSQLSVSSLLRQ